MKYLQPILLFLFVIACYSGLQLLNSAFDKGDMRKASKYFYALELSPEYPHNFHYALAEHLNVKEQDVLCTTNVISSYDATILIECGLKKEFKPNQSLKNFQWVVNVVSFQINAKNKLTKDFIQTLTEQGKIHVPQKTET